MGEEGNVNIENYRKKLYYRACHRGMKEMDVYLSYFAEERLAGMKVEDLAIFDRLLRIADRDLWCYFVKDEILECAEDREILSMLAEVKTHWQDRRWQDRRL